MYVKNVVNLHKFIIFLHWDVYVYVYVITHTFFVKEILTFYVTKLFLSQLSNLIT